MFTLKNIQIIKNNIIIMDIFIEGKETKRYRLAFALSEDKISVGRPFTNVPDEYYVYIRQAWQALNEYYDENGFYPEEITSMWC